MWVLFLACGLFAAQSLVFSSGEPSAKGNILGFIYDKDGTTPLEGAIIMAKNLGTGTIYESTKSDGLGIFKLPGIEKGIYIYGVKTDQGEFNANSPMGIRVGANETAKVSISICPLEKDVSSAMPAIYEEQKAKGEALVGKVVNYQPETRLSEIYVTKGYLEEGQRIHIKSGSTDFYQDVKSIKGEGVSAKRVFSGETGALRLKNRALPGDGVFLVSKRGITPLFLAPLGVATIVAGSAGIITNVLDIKDEAKPVSNFKK
jgi:hypothetical protein